MPFLFFHELIEGWVADLIADPPSEWLLSSLTIGLLATDIFLPIPSSLVSTLAGGLLPIWSALIASWIGLNVGAIVGFGLGRAFGRPLAIRLSSTETLEQMDRVGQRYGPALLVFTRALPILAEATVLLMSLNQLTWKRFLPPVVLSNLGIAIAYSCMGKYAAEHEFLAVAMAISGALPLLLTGVIRSFLKKETGEPADA